MAQFKLPWSRIENLKLSINSLLGEKYSLAARLKKFNSNEELLIGGVWVPLLARYDKNQEPEYVRTIVLHDAQWQFIQYILEAIEQQVKGFNDVPLQDIIMHGGRRSGKSVALAAAALVWAILRPASNIWVVSLRQRHGQRIMALIKRWLPPGSWRFERRTTTLILANYSSIRAVNAAHYDSERGDSLDLLILDEAAFLNEKVYEALAPSVLDRNGVVAMSSSPNGYNWFYDKAMLIKSPEKEKRLSVRVCGLSTIDNPFLSEAAKLHAEHLKHTMSADAYKQEILGQFIPPTGKVLPDFNDDNIALVRKNVKDRFEAMERLGYIAFDMPTMHFIVGVDFNQHPISGVIVQFDETGKIYIVGEHYGHQGTEQWAKGLEERLKELGATNPQNETMIVADASGQWQGVGKQPTLARPSWSILRHLGWRVVGPVPWKKGNPHKLDRMEVMRSLTRSAAGEVRLFIDPEVSETLECFRRLDLKDGVPNNKSQYIHTWDAVSYAAFRIWGTPIGREVFGHELVSTFDKGVETLEKVDIMESGEK